MFIKTSKITVRIVVILLLVGQIFLLSNVTIAQAPVVKNVNKKKRLGKRQRISTLKRKVRFYKKRTRARKNAYVYARRKIIIYASRIRKAKTRKGRHRLIKAKNRAVRSFRHHRNKFAHFAQKIRSCKIKLARLTGANRKRAKKVLAGRASWYGSGFRTASGERFRPNALTAAMRGFRGKRVKVVNLANKKSVVVRINDYGPARWTGRVIDLSRGSFSKIASTRHGVISRVKLYVY